MVTAVPARGPNYAVSYTPQAVAIADFNGDGIADIVTGEDSSSSDAGMVSILVGLAATAGPTPTATTLTASTRNCPPVRT